MNPKASMSERVRNTILISLAAIFSTILLLTVSTTPAAEDRVQALGSRIKCPVCQGESIADSPAQMATDMMNLISERVDHGDSDTAIIEEILSSFSGAVLLDPPVSGNTLVLWLAPLGVLIAGIAVILWWRRHPGSRQPRAPETESNRRRTLVSVFALLAVFVVVIVVATNSIQQRTGPLEGAADVGQEDLSNVSNETLEAVVAANADNPQIDGMRLALAGRYYDAGDYRSAFPHYLAVAQSPMATPNEVVAALVRLSWMAYDANGEVKTALDLIDQALKVDPGSQVARYIKGTLLWCGSDDVGGAARLFAELLSEPDLADDSKAQIELDLARVQNNESCA